MQSQLLQFRRLINYTENCLIILSLNGLNPRQKALHDEVILEQFLIRGHLTGQRLQRRGQLQEGQPRHPAARDAQGYTHIQSSGT